MIKSKRPSLLLSGMIIYLQWRYSRHGCYLTFYIYLVTNPITVYSYGLIFNCTNVAQALDSVTTLTEGQCLMFVYEWAHLGSNGDLL